MGITHERDLQDQRQGDLHNFEQINSRKLRHAGAMSAWAMGKKDMPKDVWGEIYNSGVNDLIEDLLRARPRRRTRYVTIGVKFSHR